MTHQAHDIIRILKLEPLPREGGMWVQSYRDDHSSAIYFLIQDGDFSAMHRLPGPEIWHFHAGAPARMLLLFADGRSSEPILGSDLAAGQRPQVAVPSGVWQGASSTGDWSLLGTTMAPPYREDSFEVGDGNLLGAHFPSVRSRIRELTR
jgi:hypothetical protein